MWKYSHLCLHKMPKMSLEFLLSNYHLQHPPKYHSVISMGPPVVPDPTRTSWRLGRSPPGFIAIVEFQRRRRQWRPTPILWPGKSHGWRSLVGCSPWGHLESDMTDRLHFHFPLLCIGEGNGNPLQCSCLENPRDGVAQSQTQLKWLSSSRVPKNPRHSRFLRLLLQIRKFPETLVESPKVTKLAEHRARIRKHVLWLRVRLL